jgi:hypothetical protein
MPEIPARKPFGDKMNSFNTFRIVLVTLALVTGSYALASSWAGWSSLDRPAFPSDPAKIASPMAGDAPGWLQFVSPFRSDLERNSALTTALQAIQSGSERQTAETFSRNAAAEDRVKKSLSIGPYDPELWLGLALLQAQRNPRSKSLVEALKMSYFVAPNEMKLMPVRLDTVTRFDAPSDPDLKELARGDVRVMVTRQPELRTAVVSAYRRASSLGKTFLEDAVQSIDPTFLATLRG